MGHVVEECGDGTHDLNVCEWGDWLHWVSEPAGSGARGGKGGWIDGGRGGGGLAGGSRGGRRGGMARGDRGGRTHTMEGMGGGTERVDAVVGMDLVQYKSMLAAEDRTARKRLVSDDGTINVRGQPVPNLAGKVADRVLLIENGGAAVGVHATEPNSTPGKQPIVKRRRQGEGVDGDENAADMETSDEAASEWEDRRAQ